MRAGELNQRLKLQENQAEAGAYNERLPVWVDLATLWGSVTPVSAREYIEQERGQEEISHKVKIRYRPGILPNKMRLLLGTRVLRIVGPPLDTGERHRELLLMCREVLP